jgi:uncharacterized protein
MARKARTRRKSRKPAGAIAGFGALRAIVTGGWGRFALGIAIGLVIGVGGALYLDRANLLPRGAIAIIAPNPIQKAPEQTQKKDVKKAEAPKLVEPDTPASAPATKSRPEGEEAKTKPTAPPPQPVETQTATIAPPPPAGGGPAWLKNAVAFNVPAGRPIIAVVLDDVGVAPAHAELAIDLPPAITLSFMTYADGVADMARRASAKGHELMLHVPMEPLKHDVDPGPYVLTVGASDAELLQRLSWGLGRFSGYIGINNHMGSRFTQDERGMTVVLRELQRRGLLFLDSRTVSNTVGDKVAARMGMPHVMRDVFLDDELGEAAVLKQLAQAERVATLKGQAIAIGHPHPATIAAIKAWLPKAQARGFVIVPLSAVAKQRLGASG